MTEPLHHIIMILLGIITGGNGFLVQAGGLDFTNKSRLFANPGMQCMSILPPPPNLISKT